MYMKNALGLKAYKGALGNSQFRRKVHRVAQEAEQVHILQAMTLQDSNPVRQRHRSMKLFLALLIPFLSFCFDSHHFHFRDKSQFSLEYR